ncbi:MAG: hypothetical protein KBT76_15520 [Sulfitobacter litoralis]|nr:hypothetical protein [Sulfitobacter litoralis]
MNLSARNATQAETIDRIRLERGDMRDQIERLTSRVQTLQGMVDWMRNRIAELEAQTTPQAIAERLFNEQ